MMSYLINGDEKQCTKCGACISVCPKNAIKYRIKGGREEYPSINQEVCIECGLCTQVCHMDLQINEINFNAPRFIACKHNDSEVVKKSSSGGAFYALARYILVNGGVVYGAAWNYVMEVQHIEVTTMEKLYLFHGSKYVESDLSIVFKNIKKRLNENRWVLFSGTPCHVASLYAYLRKDYEKLITCDLICHGLPKRTIWKKYINEMQKSVGSKVIYAEFKNKTEGWRKPHLVLYLENGEKISDFIWNTVYGKLYHGRYSVLSSCNSCRYAKMPRFSDITIGDFWGYREEIDHLGTDGVSLLILNTNRGKEFFDNIKNTLDFCEVSVDRAMQKHLKESAVAPPRTKQVLYDLLVKFLPLEYVVKILFK